MSRLATLPRIMVAPNGARRGKADHPALPVTIGETVVDARACFEAGADALHAHVRDDQGAHVLDAGLYAELIAEMQVAVPDMPVQITTEAVGRYAPEEQRAVARKVAAEGVSVALREMWPDDGHDPEAARFYAEMAEARCAVQHILYSPDDVTRFAGLVAEGWIAPDCQVLFVLGKYQPPVLGRSENLAGYLAVLGPVSRAQWGACAFGAGEQDCLLAAARAGGGMRIGFENSIEAASGGQALSNAEQVRALAAALD